MISAIHQHESAMGVYVFPHPKPASYLPSPPHPPGWSQCTGFECPASCIELTLVIYFTYGNVHVSVLFSQIIPPSPSPRVPKHVRYICVFCHLAYRVIITVFLNSIYIYNCVNILYWCFSFLLHSV